MKEILGDNLKQFFDVVDESCELILQSSMV